MNKFKKFFTGFIVFLFCFFGLKSTYAMEKKENIFSNKQDFNNMHHFTGSKIKDVNFHGFDVYFRKDGKQKLVFFVLPDDSDFCKKDERFYFYDGKGNRRPKNLRLVFSNLSSDKIIFDSVLYPHTLGNGNLSYFSSGNNGKYLDIKNIEPNTKYEISLYIGEEFGETLKQGIDNSWKGLGNFIINSAKMASNMISNMKVSGFTSTYLGQISPYNFNIPDNRDDLEDFKNKIKYLKEIKAKKEKIEKNKVNNINNYNKSEFTYFIDLNKNEEDIKSFDIQIYGLKERGYDNSLLVEIYSKENNKEPVATSIAEMKDENNNVVCHSCKVDVTGDKDKYYANWFEFGKEYILKIKESEEKLIAEGHLLIEKNIDHYGNKNPCEPCENKNRSLLFENSNESFGWTIYYQPSMDLKLVNGSNNENNINLDEYNKEYNNYNNYVFEQFCDRFYSGDSEYGDRGFI